MKKTMLILACVIASIVSFGQVHGVAGAGFTHTGKAHDDGRLTAELGTQIGWGTLSAIGEVDASKLKDYSVGANYRVAFGNQVFKPFLGVGGTVDLFEDNKLAFKPTAGLVISKPENTPVGLILYAQGTYKQKSTSYYEGGVKLILTF